MSQAIQRTSSTLRILETLLLNIVEIVFFDERGKECRVLHRNILFPSVHSYLADLLIFLQANMRRVFGKYKYRATLNKTRLNSHDHKYYVTSFLFLSFFHGFVTIDSLSFFTTDGVELG